MGGKFEDAEVAQRQVSLLSLRVHHCWSCHLVTLAVESGNPTAPAVKGHVVQSLQKNPTSTGCAAILSVSTQKLPHNYLNIASPPRCLCFLQANLHVVYMPRW